MLDALFGFQFKGEIREPFLSIINQVKQSDLPVISVDVPSGWSIDCSDNTKNTQGF